MTLPASMWTAPHDPADTDPFGIDAAERQAQDADREARWTEFVTRCQDFAALEPLGYAAVLSAVSRAMREELPR